jgi:hypothetical protein
MYVTPIVRLIGEFTDAGRTLAAPLAAFGFIASALQLLVAHVMAVRAARSWAKPA